MREREKEKLFQSSTKFFLDSISEDIEEMEKLGFNYKKQLEIINQSSGRDIKYSTYVRYMKKRTKGFLPTIVRHRKKFQFEAIPNIEELYSIIPLEPI